MAAPYLTKPGRHGTLYRFRIVYKQRGDDGCPEFSWHCWAYDVEHAQDRFLSDDDDGWEILSVARLREDWRATEMREARSRRVS